MAGELALPVPPGFVLTTRACRAYLEHGWTPELDAALREGMAGLEAQAGLRFGGTDAPLLVSVRSGAPASMPGMLDTVLNVGLDATTTAALARANPRLAEECRARLADSFHASVGSEPPTDVDAQLRAAVEAVFRSARSARATAYRRREGLSGDALTAVNVQAMVFGNRDARSATGVFFTRDPATGEPRPYGDVLFQAQGEDVVSGRHATQPFSELERRLPDAAAALLEMADRLERTYRDLCEIEFTIESGTLWLLQVRVGKRSPRAALRIAYDLASDPDFPLDRREAVERVRALLASPPQETAIGGVAAGAQGAAASTSSAPPPARAPIARGLGASPGVATGEIATTVERALARASEGHAVILVRPETSPEDVEGMAVAAGLLTSRGGLASHAAVVARGWGIPAVVGLAALAIDERGFSVAGHRFAVGEPISIDGRTGDVHPGRIAIESRVAPEAARLLEWARELGIAIEAVVPAVEAHAPTLPTSGEAGRPPAGAADRGVPGGAGVGTITSGDPSASAAEEALIQLLAIKGSATREALAAAGGVDPGAIDALLAPLLEAGVLIPAKPIGLRLGDAGRGRAIDLLARDRERLGVDRARAALESFQPLDARMKQAVTDWQLRLDGDERVPNDHTDARWDAGVTNRITATCADAREWLDALTPRLPRIERYAARIAAALAALRDGDGRFVASPRVDSVHGVWFELHEDLIRLAGSSRAEELAAGRAG